MKQIFAFFIFITSIYIKTGAQPPVFTNKAILQQSGFIFIDSCANASDLCYSNSEKYNYSISKNYANQTDYKPIYWDVYDSTLFQICLHYDHTGTMLSELRFYNLNKLRSIAETDLYGYMTGKETLADNTLPTFWYSMRIALGLDTLQGPLYFDFNANTENLYIYIYIHGVKKLEIWNYNYYKLLSRELSFEERLERQNRGSWSRIGFVPANLSAPFRVVHTHGEDYLITTAGDILHIGKNSVELAGKLPSLPGKGILVIDKGKDAVYFMEERWMEEAQKRPLEEIINENAIRILPEK
jgi:hypothetical protein